MGASRTAHVTANWAVSSINACAVGWANFCLKRRTRPSTVLPITEIKQSAAPAETSLN